ncbi:MAG: glycosyltransferase, partial [Methanobrevibacter sp.]|nr:glycosyltransferase [Candidatus Methanoflexus mossambicus]
MRLGGFFISYRFSVIVPAYNVEKHLVTTLDSLLNQTFQDFEVIVINDGSTDSTKDIIDSYCDKHSNFVAIHQENQGVAVARNNALKIAKGDYIGFLDGDGDYYLGDALENFNNTLNDHKSHDKSDFIDLVIGRQTMIDPWSETSYLNAKELSNLDDIKPCDPRILWTMSLFNKVFSRKKIEEIGLTMPLMNQASDAGFTLPFVYKCDKIVGCPHEIVVYKKRLFFDQYSLSQELNTGTLGDYYKSYEIIKEKFEEFFTEYKNSYENSLNNYNNSLKNENNKDGKLKELKKIYLEYIDTLIYREVSVLFIDQIYRFFWRSDRKILEKNKEILDSYKEELFPTSWNKLLKANQDIDLNNLISDPAILAENPIITIVLNDFEINSKEDALNRIANNIYKSQFPAFELIVSQESYDLLNEDIKNKNNIQKIQIAKSDSSNPKSQIKSQIKSHEFKNIAIDRAKGDYILFIDDDILLAPKVLLYMFRNIVDSEYDFVVRNMESLVEDDISKEDYSINKFSKRDLIYSNKKYDQIISNKLIKTDFLKENSFKFTEKIAHDIQKLYEIGSYEEFNWFYILSTNKYLKDPFISVFIDNIDITKKDLNLLLESIYLQSFNCFDIFINSKLKDKIADEFLKNTNINFIRDSNFKEIAISESNSKYGIFIDLPVIFTKSTFENLFFKMEEENIKNNVNNYYDFISLPIYQYNCVKDNDKIKKETEKEIKEETEKETEKLDFPCNLNQRKEIRFFSSQELIYSHKNIVVPSN